MGCQHSGVRALKPDGGADVKVILALSFTLREENTEIRVVLAPHWELFLYYLHTTGWVLLNIYCGEEPYRLYSRK